MEFLQPSWLWGILAVTVPVAIHFWNQKKGKTIEWAASRWLLDKTTLNHRGIRLHEIPLMLVRCLLLILLAFILGKPVLEWLNRSGEKQVVHLVLPDRALVSNFRFELENALKKGEKVFWIGPELNNVEELSEIPAVRESELYLQRTINKTAGAGSNLKLYLRANQQLAGLPKVYVSGPFQIYALTDSSKKRPATLKFGQGKEIHALLSYKNSVEQETVRAGLMALTDVYQVPFKIDLEAGPGKKYDLILTDHISNVINPQTLYVVSGKAERPNLPDNVLQIPDSLRLSSSEIVENGRLPELLGQALLKHYNLAENNAPLSNRQLNALFVKSKPVRDTRAEQVRKWLLLVFVFTVLLERWMSLRKILNTSYA